MVPSYWGFGVWERSCHIGFLKICLNLSRSFVSFLPDVDSERHEEGLYFRDDVSSFREVTNGISGTRIVNKDTETNLDQGSGSYKRTCINSR